jgi:VWFA-related protein
VRHTIHRLVWALATIGVVGIVRAQTGSPQDPPQPPPKFRVDANFVRVDAYPIRDGKPVVGLKAEDFEILEDGAPQRVETFEHVVVRPAGAQEQRTDPGSQRSMLQAVGNPRNRVFVIFLDTAHVDVSSAHAINEPLIRLINRILGPDDLVGVMTPAMAATQMVFGRKTQVIEESLRRNWPWGDRFSTASRDRREQAYQACYPLLTHERGPESALAREMILRKRERATLDALEDLVKYLRLIREERKAILTVTEGWLLYRENRELTKLREDPAVKWKEPVPTLEPVGVGPNGTLTTKDPRERSDGYLNKSECDGDRAMLAMLDNDRYFKDILDEANFANASFYPVDPRGLPAFDNPIGPIPPPPPLVDQAMLKHRIEVMRTMAENTDGIAAVNNNDLDRALQRISDDLTSYYLLGYYSSNSKLDGRFRSIKVGVKQPGVEVRARRGYRSATEAEVTSARRAADAPIPDIVRATNAALDRLGRVRPEARFRIHAVTGGKGTLWVAGEFQAVAGQPDAFAQGATAVIEAAAGGSSTTSKVAMKAGERTFLSSLALPQGATGPLDIRVRVTASEAGGLPLSDSIRLETAAKGEPLLFRRGTSTGNRVVPAADFRFSRTERVRLEIPVEDAKPGAGRVLDRAGQPLQVPVTTGERVDATSGQRWVTADVNLAALAPGDYVIEVAVQGASEERTLVGIRVTR